MMKFFINILPLFVIKLIYRTLPPTACFRTTLGRVFRLIRITDDFCIAISSEKYDKEVLKNLMAMKEKGQQMIDTAIYGINQLDYDNREKIAKEMQKKKGRLD